MTATPYLGKLLQSGYKVQIEQGRLSVLFLTGNPRELSKEEQARLVVEITGLLSIPLLTYQGYKTGLYSVSDNIKKATLYMMLEVAGKPQENAYSLFNVETNYTRTTAKHKKGDPLPSGQFRVKNRSKFTGLWLACGLPLPDGGKLSAFHRYMGKLSGLLLTGQQDPKKPEKYNGLSPVTISHETIMTAQQQAQALKPVPNLPLTYPQPAPNLSLMAVPKESEPRQIPRAFEPDSGTDQNNTNKGQQLKANHNQNEEVYTEQSPANNQSNDDWLAEYAEGKRA